MRKTIADHGTTIVVAAIVAALTAAVPSVAASAAHATSSDTATSAADATRLAGLTPVQLTQTRVDALDPAATLDTSPSATVSFTAPSAGYVTWHASCEFISVTPTVQANLVTTTDIGGDGAETTRSHRANLTNAPFNIQAVAATDWAAVSAGQVIVVGATATAASNGADITCKNGRVVATYSATTTEG